MSFSNIYILLSPKTKGLSGVKMLPCFFALVSLLLVDRLGLAQALRGTGKAVTCDKPKEWQRSGKKTLCKLGKGRVSERFWSLLSLENK